MSKTVFITGASSGFGKAAALEFTRQGWRVAATMRNPSAWTEPPSDNVIVLPLDLEVEASIPAALAAAKERFGQINCVVNNAGQGLASIVESTPLDFAKRLFDVNFFGCLQVMQHAIPLFRAAGGGRFVNVSSSSATSPEPLMGIYSASKFAVEGLTEAARSELRPFGIELKLIEPGFVRETNIVNVTMENAKAAPVPDAYKEYFNWTVQAFMGHVPYEFATAEDIAAAIFAAATTDETNKFRYPVGEDAEASAFMRRATSEASYEQFARLRADGDFLGAYNFYKAYRERVSGT